MLVCLFACTGRDVKILGLRKLGAWGAWKWVERKGVE